MKNKIIEKVGELCALAGVPSIACEFGLKGKVAGKFTAKGDAVALQFNLIFATNHPDEYMARTVVHEVAHYVRYARNGFSPDLQPNGKCDYHGDKWRSVMKELSPVDENGVLIYEITRTHKYDTSVIKGRVYKKFEYSCDEGHTYQLTAIRHNRSQKGTMWYNCRECDSRLHFRG